MTKRKYFGAAPYATWDACLTLAQPWLDAVHFGQVIRVDAGEFLFHEGEIHGYFYLLRSGLVSSKVLRRSGSEILLEVFGPGAIFGEGPAFPKYHDRLRHGRRPLVY